MLGTPMGWRPMRPAVGCFASTTLSRRVQGTTCSISPRNFSRCVARFFCSNSKLAKPCCLLGDGLGFIGLNTRNIRAELISVSPT